MRSEIESNRAMEYRSHGLSSEALNARLSNFGVASPGVYMARITYMDRSPRVRRVESARKEQGIAGSLAWCVRPHRGELFERSQRPVQSSARCHRHVPPAVATVPPPRNPAILTICISARLYAAARHDRLPAIRYNVPVENKLVHLSNERVYRTVESWAAGFRGWSRECTWGKSFDAKRRSFSFIVFPFLFSVFLFLFVFSIR